MVGSVSVLLFGIIKYSSKIKGSDLERFVADNDKSNQEDINAIATNIMIFLRDQQPYFNIQAFVATMNDRYENGRDINRTGCDKDLSPDCETRFDDTGHFWFNDIQGLTISVRYRYNIKGTVEGLDKFPTFFQKMISE